jgi:hypothetical protein
MFQFASVLGITISKNVNIIVNCKSEINLFFKLNGDLTLNTDICSNMQLLIENISSGLRWAKYMTFVSNITDKGFVTSAIVNKELIIKYGINSCVCIAVHSVINMQLLIENISSGFDRNKVQLIKDNSFRVGKYLQSWKYFDTISSKLRKQLIFRDDINREARGIVKNILLKRNLTRHTTTLVGVHIRRGDMINDKYFINYGYEVATPLWLSRPFKICHFSIC